MWILENCIIRRARKEDLAKIKNFMQSLSDFERSYFSEEFEFFDSNSEVLIAEISEEIVGIAVIRFYSEKGRRHVANLLITVKEELRGKGIGYNLNLVAEEVAQSKGVIKLKIETPTFNIYPISRAEIWGYCREAYLEKEFYLNGKYYDVVVLSKMLQAKVRFNNFLYD
ncbi:MAG: GNAT family N-acetyltransferase [Archaeoglobaceae archaeon]